MTAAAHRQAAMFFDRSLAALEHLPADRDVIDQRIDLHLSLRYALFPLGDIARIGEETAKAEALATTLGDPRQRARTAIFRTHYLWVTGSVGPALASAISAHRLAVEASNATLVDFATLLLGAVHSARGDYRQAAELLSTPEGLALLEEAVSPSAVMPHVHSAAFVQMQLGWGYLLAGRIDDAAGVAARALALARERQDRGAEGYALRLLGETAMASGPSHVNDAHAWFSEALGIAETQGMRPLAALCRDGLNRSSA